MIKITITLIDRHINTNKRQNKLELGTTPCFQTITEAKVVTFYPLPPPSWVLELQAGPPRLLSNFQASPMLSKHILSSRIWELHPISVQQHGLEPPHGLFSLQHRLKWPRPLLDFTDLSRDLLPPTEQKSPENHAPLPCGMLNTLHLEPRGAWCHILAMSDDSKTSRH